MERLTFDGKFCDIAKCMEVPGGSICETGMCSQRKVWERLKSYEDTGLEPEDIRPQMEILRKYSESADGIGLKRLRELAQAEKDGRMVVLPCKVGDPVYVTYGEGYRLHVVDRIYVTGNQEVQVRMRNPCTMSETLRLNASNFGKTVFLTREEAEKALRKEAEK